MPMFMSEMTAKQKRRNQKLSVWLVLPILKGF